jgi:hypothetical protein
MDTWAGWTLLACCWLSAIALWWWPPSVNTALASLVTVSLYVVETTTDWPWWATLLPNAVWFAAAALVALHCTRDLPTVVWTVWLVVGGAWALTATLAWAVVPGFQWTSVDPDGHGALWLWVLWPVLAVVTVLWLVLGARWRQRCHGGGSGGLYGALSVQHSEA